uniref:Olfactory receptor family 51 subfamily S member 1 n=1 Tax=Sarcophilus harrisii TaxID=9305 RepID=A0A7N4P3B9_SARHA
TSNNTSMIPTFLLVGIPGLVTTPSWWALIFIAIYLLCALGNGAVLWVIAVEPSLHRPMYYFLFLLGVSDMGLVTALMPTLLKLSLFDSHTVPAFSSVLLAMAFDRALAICHPLRYSALLTNSVTSKIGLVIIFRCVSLHLPLPFLLAWMPYCHPQVLSHSYCLHPDISRLSCPGAQGATYSFFVVLSAMGLDPVLIFLSYALIGQALRDVVSPEDRRRAQNTCAVHLSAVLLFYVPMILLAFTDRLRLPIPHAAHTFLSYIHFLLPPLLNPVLYSVKMREVREKILRQLQPMKVRSFP